LDFSLAFYHCQIIDVNFKVPFCSLSVVIVFLTSVYTEDQLKAGRNSLLASIESRPLTFGIFEMTLVGAMSRIEIILLSTKNNPKATIKSVTIQLEFKVVKWNYKPILTPFLPFRLSPVSSFHKIFIRD